MILLFVRICTVVSRESVMRFAFGSRRYTEKELENRHLVVPDDQVPLTPGQQLALLTVRQSDLSQRVINKLMHGTARPGRSDYDHLRSIGYAERQSNGLHAITPRGQWHADNLARDLAIEFKVPLRSETERRQDAKWWRHASQAGW